MDPKRIEAAKRGDLKYRSGHCPKDLPGTDKFRRTRCGCQMRYTSTGQCVECVRRRAAERYAKTKAILQAARDGVTVDE